MKPTLRHAPKENGIFKVNPCLRYMVLIADKWYVGKFCCDNGHYGNPDWYFICDFCHDRPSYMVHKNVRLRECQDIYIVDTAIQDKSCFPYLKDLDTSSEIEAGTRPCGTFEEGTFAGFGRFRYSVEGLCEANNTWYGRLTLYLPENVLVLFSGNNTLLLGSPLSRMWGYVSHSFLEVSDGGSVLQPYRYLSKIIDGTTKEQLVENLKMGIRMAALPFKDLQIPTKVDLLDESKMPPVPESIIYCDIPGGIIMLNPGVFADRPAYAIQIDAYLSQENGQLCKSSQNSDIEFFGWYLDGLWGNSTGYDAPYRYIQLVCEDSDPQKNFEKVVWYIRRQINRLRSNSKTTDSHFSYTTTPKGYFGKIIGGEFSINYLSLTSGRNHFAQLIVKLPAKNGYLIPELARVPHRKFMGEWLKSTWGSQMQERRIEIKQFSAESKEAVLEKALAYLKREASNL